MGLALKFQRRQKETLGELNLEMGGRGGISSHHTQGLQDSLEKCRQRFLLRMRRGSRGGNLGKHRGLGTAALRERQGSQPGGLA